MGIVSKRTFSEPLVYGQKRRLPSFSLSLDFAGLHHLVCFIYQKRSPLVQQHPCPLAFCSFDCFRVIDSTLLWSSRIQTSIKLALHSIDLYHPFSGDARADIVGQIQRWNNPNRALTHSYQYCSANDIGLRWNSQCQPSLGLCQSQLCLSTFSLHVDAQPHLPIDGSFQRHRDFKRQIINVFCRPRKLFPITTKSSSQNRCLIIWSLSSKLLVQTSIPLDVFQQELLPIEE